MGPRISLNMIVKNEAHVIARCLDSVRQFVTSWSIVDTGSSDGTQAILRKCLSDLPGELHERPWRNFGANRTEAIELAGDEADYLLVIDADEVLEADSSFVMPPLSFDAYQLKTVLGGISYYRTQLIRTALPWRYAGVLHEYLECATPFTQGRLEGLVNRPRPDGARSCDPDKFTKDASVLEDALEREPNNARYAFYLAQSYRDAGLLDEAIAAYDRRATMGGWPEESYCALFEAARQRERAGRPGPEIVAGYLAAYDCRPTRAESLCELARYHRLQGRHALALLFAEKAAKILMPADILFVDTGVYDWRAIDELSLAWHFLGQQGEAIRLAQSLLDGGKLPEPERPRLERNLAFMQRARAALSDGAAPP